MTFQRLGGSAPMRGAILALSMVALTACGYIVTRSVRSAPDVHLRNYEPFAIQLANPAAKPTIITGQGASAVLIGNDASGAAANYAQTVIESVRFELSDQGFHTVIDTTDAKGIAEISLVGAYMSAGGYWRAQEVVLRMRVRGTTEIVAQYSALGQEAPMTISSLVREVVDRMHRER